MNNDLEKYVVYLSCTVGIIQTCELNNYFRALNVLQPLILSLEAVPPIL